MSINQIPSSMLVKQLKRQETVMNILHAIHNFAVAK